MGRIWMPGIEIIDYCEWFFLCRQMPPTPQISAAAAATMATPAMPDTDVPAAESLPAKE